MGLFSGTATTTTNQNTQNTLDPQDQFFLNRSVGQLGSETRNFQGLANTAQERLDPSLRAFEQGRLGTREQGLLSQLAQRQRQLQSARQTALASSGLGQKTQNILGAQGQLQSDLGLNQARFQAAEQQQGNIAAQQAGLSGLLGLGQAGLQAKQGLINSQLGLAGLRKSSTTNQTQTTPTGGLLGDLGGALGKGLGVLSGGASGLASILSGGNVRNTLQGKG